MSEAAVPRLASRAGCSCWFGPASTLDFREAIPMNASLKPVETAAEAEQRARVDLAACYRLAERFGLNEGIDNHLTLLVPGYLTDSCLHRLACIGRR